MSGVYVIAATRTAIGAFSGTLKDTGAAELGTAVSQSALERAGIPGSSVEEVIFGNVLSAGLGQNVGRQIALRAGIPQESPAFTVNAVCASGMKALQLAYQAIDAGEAEVVLAGGVENMNQAPYLARGARFGLRMNDSVLEDSMVKDGLWCAMGGYHMGITAENLAEKYGISRQAQDEFAAASQQKAARAVADDEFHEEIAPVTLIQRKGAVVFQTDEPPRPDTTAAALEKLRPAFRPDGTVTAGNASSIADGAAALVLAGDAFVRRHGLTPLAEVLGFASVGVQPEIMGIGPVTAVQKLLNKIGWKLDEIDLFELNEAFAAQSLAVLRELRVDPEKLNVNGGAIALGHPIGASGARIVVTLLYAMRRRNAKTGLAALCVGGGMGMAAAFRLPS